MAFFRTLLPRFWLLAAYFHVGFLVLTLALSLVAGGPLVTAAFRSVGANPVGIVAMETLACVVSFANYHYLRLFQTRASSAKTLRMYSVIALVLVPIGTLLGLLNLLYLSCSKSGPASHS